MPPPGLMAHMIHSQSHLHMQHMTLWSHEAWSNMVHHYSLSFVLRSSAYFSFQRLFRDSSFGFFCVFPQVTQDNGASGGMEKDSTSTATNELDELLF